ncbi:branched-chain amino acid ABC transporter permease [Pseudonocardia kunmingensis]|uniref:Amino acid/amide ABC transporter membrane protein 1 (HAAT family) n=1 Tax=Pseudonocardia kunmingensis TaxID=630975 RepID=A0A543DLA0_9PSEU|nr:branched-chain amino acid ABC transporter permease [Pseudonocardia kunmingensis]TQM10099.1 amino acid/amide ABC transporter membrane protein 1 (HAAT family) [Pseudonocardia kunmingensis]
MDLAANFGAAPQLAFDGLLVGSFYAMLAVSFGIIFSTTRTFHFAHALTFTVGAYAGVLVAEAGVAFWAAIVVGGVVAGCFGVATDLVVYRPLRRRGASSLNVFLAALGVLIAGEAVVQFAFGPNSRPLPGAPTGGVQFGALATGWLQILIAVISWGAVLAVAAFLHFSKYGLAVRAVESNAVLADAFGVSRILIYELVFFLGSLLAGVGGVLFAARDTATPGMGVAPLLSGFIAVFIGGIGSIPGAVVGGLLLGMATSLGGIVLPGYLTSIVAFVILFAVLVVRPRGLLARRAV